MACQTRHNKLVSNSLVGMALDPYKNVSVPGSSVLTMPWKFLLSFVITGKSVVPHYTHFPASASCAVSITVYLMNGEAQHDRM